MHLNTFAFCVEAAWLDRQLPQWRTGQMSFNLLGAIWKTCSVMPEGAVVTVVAKRLPDQPTNAWGMLGAGADVGAVAELLEMAEAAKAKGALLTAEDTAPFHKRLSEIQDGIARGVGAAKLG